VVLWEIVYVEKLNSSNFCVCGKFSDVLGYCVWGDRFGELGYFMWGHKC